MAISSALTSAASLLLKTPYPDLRVIVRHESVFRGASKCFSVLVIANVNGKPAQGYSRSDRLNIAFTKALCEFGEVIVARQLSLANRNGLAGGVFKRTAIGRAKSELLERDAFLYHYRNHIPFKLCKKMDPPSMSQGSLVLWCFTMTPASPKYHAYFVIDEESLNGKRGCMIFGTGCSTDQSEAQSRALREFETLYMRHLASPDWCSSIPNKLVEASNIFDFHHAASKDLRNHAILRTLTACQIDTEKRLPFDDAAWQITSHRSPLRLFKYILAKHESLVPMEFGSFEDARILRNLADDVSQNGASLFHPFW